MTDYTIYVRTGWSTYTISEEVRNEQLIDWLKLEQYVNLSHVFGDLCLIIVLKPTVIQEIKCYVTR